MAFDIGSATNRGPSGLAHHELIRKIKACATGCGRVVQFPFTGTGTGVLTIVSTTPTTVDETITLTLTSSTAFSVVGSVGGTYATGTVGVLYSNSKIELMLLQGDTVFSSGDKFVIVTKASSLPIGQRWVIVDQRTVGTELEVYLKGPGTSEDKEIYIGFRTYSNVAADYYNISIAGFVGHEPGAPWASQPGFTESGIPAHNQNINYWIHVDGNSINLTLGVGSPVVYESGGVGFFLPYCPPSQYKYPMYVSGMLTGAAAIRYSDVSHTMGWKGSRNNLKIRSSSGSWVNPVTWPWSNAFVGGSTTQMRDTGGEYPMLGIQLYENNLNLWGQFDNIRYVSNFNNTVESVVQYGGTPVLDNPTWTSHQLVQAILDAGGEPWVCLQDVGRTSFNDYFSMRVK